MKTRRRIIKSPTKGRRSSIISIKRCPRTRNSSRRALLTTNNATNDKIQTRLTQYESPLQHLRHNCLNEIPSTSTNFRPKNEIIIDSTTQDNETKKEIDNISIIDLSSSLNTSKVLDLKEDTSHIFEISNECSNNSTNFEINNASTKCKKRKKRILKQLYNKKRIKTQKVNKSPLSKPKENSEFEKVSDSIMFEEDKTKPVFLKSEDVATSSSSIKHCTLDESLSKTILIESPKPFEMIKSEMKYDDVVVIDSNESLLEMEAYHNAFNESTKSKVENPEMKDSIIVIDDEPYGETKNVSSTANEDCFVVWSSLPQPCTSTSDSSDIIQNTLEINPWSNNNSLLKCDKIFLDTRAELSNLRYLNNENSKPLTKRITKSPKVQKSVKRSSLKTYINTIETSTRVTGKAKATTKVTEKKQTSTHKKKVKKNSEELIFLSESTQDLTKEKKFRKGKLREIVVDGNNVGMAYSNNKNFSEKGIKLIIDYFTKKGHTVKVFIPQYRRSRNYPLLEKWNTEGIVVFTPSRKLGNKSYTPYDDRYIIEYATMCNGIVVSQDQFRDLYAEKSEYRDTIENRLLVPTFVGDYVMFPVDPLGRNGPTLTEFLKH